MFKFVGIGFPAQFLGFYNTNGSLATHISPNIEQKLNSEILKMRNLPIENSQSYLIPFQHRDCLYFLYTDGVRPTVKYNLTLGNHRTIAGNTQFYSILN